MVTIETTSKKANRNIVTPIPDILQMTTVKNLVEVMGEELVVAKVQAQLTIDFRAKIRGMLESGDLENGVFTYSDDDILNMDFSDWKPEMRTRKTPEEKLLAAIAASGMSPEQIKAIIDAA